MAAMVFGRRNDATDRYACHLLRSPGGFMGSMALPIKAMERRFAVVRRPVACRICCFREKTGRNGLFGIQFLRAYSFPVLGGDSLRYVWRGRVDRHHRTLCCLSSAEGTRLFLWTISCG